MKTHDFLLELGTEELPPKLQVKLSNALRDNLVEELVQLGIAIGKVSAYVTPRRLAVSILKIQSHQEDQLIESKSPTVGSPEKAIEGFAKSCGVDINSLEKRSLGGKNYYFFQPCERFSSLFISTQHDFAKPSIAFSGEPTEGTFFSIN